MSEKKLPIDIFICDCHSTDHQMIFMHEYEEEVEKDAEGKEIRDNDGKLIFTKKYPMCYVHVHLAPHTFWSRLKYGFKYIFGYKSRYGAFDEFIFNPSDADKLQKVVDHLKEQV